MERANQTLQNRLTKELRLRELSSLQAANAFLQEFIAAYNQRFAVAPRSTESAHRPLAKGEDLERVLTLCERRTLPRAREPAAAISPRPLSPEAALVRRS